MFSHSRKLLEEEEDNPVVTIAQMEATATSCRHLGRHGPVSEPRFERRILIPALVENPKKRKTREDGDADFIEASTTVKPPPKRTRMSRSARASTTAAQLDKGIFGLAVELLLFQVRLLRPNILFYSETHLNIISRYVTSCDHSIC